MRDRYILEMQPTRFKDKFTKNLLYTKKVFKSIHIPDAPLGYPKASVLSLGFLAVNHGFSTTVHLRVIDYSYTGLLNMIYGAYIIGIDRILFLRGDKPSKGTVVKDVSPEKSIEMLRADPRLKKLKGGLIISARYPFDSITERLKINADFYVILRRRKHVIEKIRDKSNSMLIAYFVIATENNKDYVFKNFPREDIVVIDELNNIIDEYEYLIDQFLFTAPFSLIDFIKFFKENIL